MAADKKLSALAKNTTTICFKKPFNYLHIRYLQPWVLPPHQKEAVQGNTEMSIFNIQFSIFNIQGDTETLIWWIAGADWKCFLLTSTWNHGRWHWASLWCRFQYWPLSACCWAASSWGKNMNGPFYQEKEGYLISDYKGIMINTMMSSENIGKSGNFERVWK